MTHGVALVCPTSAIDKLISSSTDSTIMYYWKSCVCEYTTTRGRLRESVVRHAAIFSTTVAPPVFRPHTTYPPHTPFRHFAFYTPLRDTVSSRDGFSCFLCICGLRKASGYSNQTFYDIFVHLNHIDFDVAFRQSFVSYCKSPLTSRFTSPPLTEVQVLPYDQKLLVLAPGVLSRTVGDASLCGSNTHY